MANRSYNSVLTKNIRSP